MVIWSRWGALALLIPLVFGFLVHEVITPTAPVIPAPVKRTVAVDDSQGADSDAEDAQQIKLRLTQQADHLKAVKRARSTGLGTGYLMAACILWPLGRWMNRTDTRTLLDPQSGQPVTLEFGGGHTLFFIPLEYWAFIWAFIALCQFIA